MRVKCLAKEHNVVPRAAGLKRAPLEQESSVLITRPPRLLHYPNLELYLLKINTDCTLSHLVLKGPQSISAYIEIKCESCRRCRLFGSYFLLFIGLLRFLVNW